jgi:hypothetical protein
MRAAPTFAQSATAVFISTAGSLEPFASFGTHHLGLDMGLLNIVTTGGLHCR